MGSGESKSEYKRVDHKQQYLNIVGSQVQSIESKSQQSKRGNQTNFFKEKQETPFNIGETFRAGNTQFTFYKFLTPQDQTDFMHQNQNPTKSQKQKEIQQQYEKCSHCLIQKVGNELYKACVCITTIHLSCFIQKRKPIFSIKQGQNFIIINMGSQRCKNCGYEFIDFKALKTIMFQLKDIIRGILFPLFIMKVKITNSGCQFISYFIYSFNGNSQFSIGKDQKCELRIQIDPQISRNHVRIIKKGNRFFINVESTKGITKVLKSYSKQKPQDQGSKHEKIN